MNYNKTEIERLYFEENMTYDQISEIVGCCKSTIGNIIRSNPNYKKKSQTLYSNPLLDENYFEIIDTEAKAYILGLMITDGNVCYYGDGYRIRLQLKYEDSYILEFFKNQIHCSNKLIVDKRDGSIAFSIKSEKMFYDLSKYGVVPNKTLNNYVPPNIHPMLMPHLIRGIFDGDGWISKSFDKNGKKHIAIGICGNENFLQQFRIY
jgi:intein-encoded DNA endonuclease-like protein